MTPRLRLAPPPGPRSQLGSEELVQMFLDGHPQAGDLIFLRFQASVNRRVACMLGPDHEHDDIVQDVFASVFKSLKKLEDPNNLEGWILGVTNHTVHHRLRYRKSRWRWYLRVSEVPEVEDDRSSSPEEREWLRRVYAALDQLPVVGRTALTLQKLEGCSIREIAVACGCSESSAKRHLADATERLRRLAARDPVLSEYLGVREGRRG